jgi:hypothetical protein
MNQTIPNVRARVGAPCAAMTEGQDCSSSSSTTTTTRAFLDILRAARPDQQLVFQLGEAPLVAAGYRVTELKAVTYNTMDCGGVADKWEETVIQLWNPGDGPEREYMTVRKFLAIYERVAKHIPVSCDAELRFEYGDKRRPAGQLSRPALGVARSADPRSPPRSRSDLQGKGSQKGQDSRRNQLLRLNLVNDAMDRAYPAAGHVQPTEPRRNAVVVALGDYPYLRLGVLLLPAGRSC